jgi:Arc/MetJ-type ribon-helix-helix transcriptional regulator
VTKIAIFVQVRTTTVRLALGVSARIDKLVGSKRRAEFIRNAVAKELKRREDRRTKE